MLTIGKTVYVKYKGCTCCGEITGREFPYWIITLTNGLELSFYEDEIDV